MTSEGSRSGISHFFLNAMRIVMALLFMQHGVQKMLGGFGARSTPDFLELRWFAGVLELWGGALILIGLWTRPVAFLLAGEMAVAYFRSHLPRGWIPIMNGGELAALYCWVFLFLAANGGGAFSVDGLWASWKRGRVEG